MKAILRLSSESNVTNPNASYESLILKEIFIHLLKRGDFPLWLFTDSFFLFELVWMVNLLICWMMSAEQLTWYGCQGKNFIINDKIGE